jgi:hypothetical protein
VNVKIGDIASNLARIDLAQTRAAALAGAAETIADAVREALSHPPGGEHAFPWRQTGALADSIAVAADGDAAIVGSTDAVAPDQEYGTATIPPRPFLAPIAAEHVDAAAERVGAAIAEALRSAVSRPLTPAP